MLNEKLEKALNEQINAELYSSYLYLSMSAWFESINFEGFASWMNVQSQEEYDHAMKIYDFVLRRGGTVKLSAIEGPKTEWKNATEVFEETLEHEKKVTGMIHNLVDLAQQEKDHPMESFLQWFVDEQVEEEDTASKILEQLKMLKESTHGLFMLDRELGQRPAAPDAGAGA